MHLLPEEIASTRRAKSARDYCIAWAHERRTVQDFGDCVRREPSDHEKRWIGVLYAKLGVQTRTEAVIIGLQRGLIILPEVYDYE